MRIQDKQPPKVKLKKTATLILIQIAVTLLVLMARQVVNAMGFELREPTLKAVWIAVAVWALLFIGLCVRLCGIVYSCPQRLKRQRIIQKIGSVSLLIAIAVLTALLYFVGLFQFAFTAKEENTFEYQGVSYISIRVPRALEPAGVTYHKAVTPFLYEIEPATDIISAETYTGVIQGWNWCGGDEGSVRVVKVDVGNGKSLDFTLVNEKTFKDSDEIPVGAKVRIECERHPNSEYRPILSISVQSP